jgi:hypothetical protein
MILNVSTNSFDFYNFLKFCQTNLSFDGNLNQPINFFCFNPIRLINRLINFVPLKQWKKIK